MTDHLEEAFAAAIRRGSVLEAVKIRQERIKVESFKEAHKYITDSWLELRLKYCQTESLTTLATNLAKTAEDMRLDPELAEVVDMQDEYLEGIKNRSCGWHKLSEGKWGCLRCDESSTNETHIPNACVNREQKIMQVDDGVYTGDRRLAVQQPTSTPTERKDWFNIRVKYEHPPIGDRRWDWLAYYEGEEEKGNYGQGSTPYMAIIDLISNYNPSDYWNSHK